MLYLVDDFGFCLAAYLYPGFLELLILIVGN